MARFHALLREIPEIVRLMRGERDDELMSMVADADKSGAWEEFLAGD